MFFSNVNKKNIQNRNRDSSVYVMNMNIQPNLSKTIALPYNKPYTSIQTETPQYTTLKQAIAPKDPSTTSTTKPMKWGEPTWYLFHTLAEKVKEEHFPLIKDQLLNLINVICNNLPCPICADHAKNYLKGINFKSIQTKTQLKEFLWTFHNTVNQRKNFPYFPREELDEKYKKAVTINIINHFIQVFSKRSLSIRLIADDFHRGRLLKDLKEWFDKNLIYFDMK
jgi:hypothetical protein